MNKLEYIPGDIVKIEYGEATGKIGFVTNTFLRRKGCYSLVVFIGKGFQGSSKDDWIQTYNDEVSPIPLTTEILEKNGWVKEVMSRGVKNSHWVYTKPDIEEYGHYPIGIDKTLTGTEYDIWRECDCGAWINNIRKNPGRHLVKHYGEVYTNYGVPFSVDDDRGGSHTELFWKGIHSEEEIVNLIKNDSFLSKQFNLK